MKTTLSTFALLLTLFASTAPVNAAETASLVIKLSGMTSDTGSMVYAMWSGPENWLESDPVREGAVPIVSGESVINLTDLTFGEYAVSVYHDLNDNRELDTGRFGIPKEPFGTSNDAKARFGPPKYKDAVFILEQPTLTIHIPVKKRF